MASTAIDNLIALKVLYMLVKPFDQTEAFKLGVIDKDGKLLVKQKDQTQQQKDAYNYLDRLVFNLKRLIAKLPGGKSMLASFVAALYLIKEDSRYTAKELEDRFNEVLNKITEQEITLVEETLILEEFLEMYTEDGAVAAVPTNATGPAVSTDVPTIRPKKKKPRRYATFEVEEDTFNKFKKGKKKFSKWSEYLNLADPEHEKIYKYAKNNPKGVLILKNGERTKGIRYNKNGGGKWHKIARRGKPVDVIHVENM